MPSEIVKFQGGGGAIIHTLWRRKKCHQCDAPSTKLCDHVKASGKTCDRPMCDKHATRGDMPDIDFCNKHSQQQSERPAMKKTEARSPAGEVEKPTQQAPMSGGGGQKEAKIAHSPVEITLSDDQRAVMDATERGESLLVTGSAGTGKSTLLREMDLKYQGSLSVCASTGIAAVNVGGLTIYSWAGIGIGIGIGDDTAANIAERLEKRRGEAYHRIRNYKMLAIDEISIISGKIFNLLDGVFQAVRKNGKPFGGMQLILFGDFLQLPPVIKSAEEEAEGKFCFQSRAWKSAGIKVAMLKQVYRQKDQVFSSALNEIRMGEPSEAAYALLKARYNALDEAPQIEPVLVHTHNADVDMANSERLMKIDGAEERYRAHDFGKPGPLATLQSNCLAPETLKLKIGAQVMLLKNLDPSGGLANGSIGKVTGFTKTKLPQVEFTNGLTIDVDTEKFEIKSGGEVLASRTQIPLRLAWAITVHKSQGMTLDKIQVHLANVFEDGQAYVALSRASKAEGLFIKSGNRGNIRANSVAVEFYRKAATI